MNNTGQNMKRGVANRLFDLTIVGFPLAVDWMDNKHLWRAKHERNSKKLG